MATTMNVKLLQIVKTTSEWTTWDTENTKTGGLNVKLAKGLVLVETKSDSTTWVKIGDGEATKFADLPYITDGAIASLGQFMNLKGVVASIDLLPTTGNKAGDVYLVGTASEEENDFTEYVWVVTGSPATGAWELLGSAGISFTNYDAKVGGGLSMTDGTSGDGQEGKKVFSITNAVTGGAGTASGSTGNLSFGGNVSIPSITYDAHGLITSTTTTTATLPSEYISSITDSGDGNAVTGISVSDGAMTVTKGSTFLTEHPTITPGTDTTSTATPAFGGTFSAISSITKDSNGHVTAVNTETVTIPSASFTGADGSTAGTTGLVPAPSSTDNVKYLKGDGNWSALPTMTGATSQNAGTSGLVPAPSAGDKDKVLTGAGTWADVSSIGVSDVTVDGTTVVSGGVAALVTDASHSYDDSTNDGKLATVGTVTAAVEALDGSITGSAAAGKTLTSFSQTDGVVTATFGDISITKSQVSDFPTNIVNAVTYDATGSNPQIKVQADGGTATAIVTVTDNDSATALTTSDTNLVTARSVANAGFAKSATMNGGSAITADSSGNIALGTVVTGATMNSGNVTVTNGVAALGSVATAITYTYDNDGTPATGTISPTASTGYLDLSDLVLQCTL